MFNETHYPSMREMSFAPETVPHEEGVEPVLDLSIIIPVLNESGNIVPLGMEVSQVMRRTGRNWECLWVDDGSTDQTILELEKLTEIEDRHRFIILSRNFGQSAAPYVGFRSTKGKILVTIDGDGQNDPGDIPILVDRLVEDNFDMVNGYRKTRRDNFLRKSSSIVANGFRNSITGEKIRDVGCSLRAFHRLCVERIPFFRGMHRFLPTLVRIGGFPRMAEVPVNHRPTSYGKTKYGVGDRLWVGIADCLAVRWMQRRVHYPQIEYSSPSQGGKGAK